jgi:hypothetical protein
VLWRLWLLSQVLRFYNYLPLRYKPRCCFGLIYGIG